MLVSKAYELHSGSSVRVCVCEYVRDCVLYFTPEKVDKGWNVLDNPIRFPDVVRTMHIIAKSRYPEQTGETVDVFRSFLARFTSCR